MRILDPENNIVSLVSLVKNAKKFVVIVSPYSYFEGWNDLVKAINEASERGVNVSYYVREKEGLEGTEALNVNLFEVPFLHAKMFFSESEAMISSFHLKNNEDINWACLVDTQEEYSDMVNFFEEYIKPKALTD